MASAAEFHRCAYVVIRAAVLSQSLGSVPASRFLATSTLVAPLHEVPRPFCYQATSHCKGQPFAAYGLSWCSAHALTAWVSFKWLSPLDTPATGLPGYNRSLPKPQPYSPRVFQAVQWSNPPSSSTAFPRPGAAYRCTLRSCRLQVAGHQSLDCYQSFHILQSTTVGPLGPAWTSYLGSVWTPTWDTPSHGRNACLTRIPLSALHVAPAALPATRGTTPVAYGCPVCAAHSLVRNPQPMSATRVPPAAGPATCAAPAASARTLAPAHWHPHAKSASRVIPAASACTVYWHPQPMPASCALLRHLTATPAKTGLHCVNTRAWFAMLVFHPTLVELLALGDCLQCTCMLKCQIQWVGASVRHGRNVCLTRKPLFALRGAPAALGLRRVPHPQQLLALGTCTLRLPRVWYARVSHLQAKPAQCDPLQLLPQRVQHLQTPACIVWTPAHGGRRDSCSPFRLVMPTLDKAAWQMDIWTLTACGALASWRANSLGCATS